MTALVKTQLGPACSSASAFGGGPLVTRGADGSFQEVEQVDEGTARVLVEASERFTRIKNAFVIGGGISMAIALAAIDPFFAVLSVYVGGAGVLAGTWAGSVARKRLFLEEAKNLGATDAVAEELFDRFRRVGGHLQRYATTGETRAETLRRTLRLPPKAFAALGPRRHGRALGTRATTSDDAGVDEGRPDPEPTKASPPGPADDDATPA